ncbi:helix-turn-helix domain-containing protein [Sporosarcina sp. SAFN-015]|uniref:helix-turn-helix domain-containing protein n=1 Tax=Sporosarcina sp. SAFN-015 TaxID=3387274 RepID=UPI003F7E1431
MPKDKVVIDFRERPFFLMTRDVVDKDTKLEKPVDIAVYAVLCMYADNNDKTSYPSVETIAKKARCSERVARRSLQNLKDAGYIDIRKRADARGFQASNQYVLLDVALS